MPFEPQTPEEIAADSVRLLIELLRVQSVQGFKSHADDLKLIKLLRKRGYEEYADEIEEKVYMAIPPAPAKTNELKFNCALYANSLMTEFTEQRPTKYKNGKFQEIAALFYSSITGEDAESDGMERACALAIKTLKDTEKLAAGRKARRLAAAREMRRRRSEDRYRRYHLKDDG